LTYPGNVSLFVGTANTSLALTLSDSGFITPGSSETFTIQVYSRSYVATAGQVTVTESIPTGLTVASVSASGWNCTTGMTVTCTRSDSLPVGGIFPTITLSLTASPNLTGAPLTTQASVSLNGVVTQGTQVSYINPSVPGLISLTQGQTGVPLNPTLSWKP